MKSLNSFIACVVLFGVAGCQDSNAPKDFPKTFSTKVTVKEGETPLEDVTVFLYAQSLKGSWAPSGVTNAGGVADLVTNQGDYMAKGVPADTYTVVLNKPVKAPSELSPEEVNNMSYDDQIAYGRKINEELAKMPPVIPTALTNPRGTPLSLTVTESGGELIVDLSDYK